MIFECLIKIRIDRPRPSIALSGEVVTFTRLTEHRLGNSRIARELFLMDVLCFKSGNDLSERWRELTPSLNPRRRIGHVFDDLRWISQQVRFHLLHEHIRIVVVVPAVSRHH